MNRCIYFPRRFALSFFLFVFLCLGCDTASVRPLTKERYLIRFDSFIQGVEKQGHTYTSDTWKETDLQYKLYKTTWYNWFRNELTLEDKTVIKNLVLRYHKVKLTAAGKSILDQTEDILLDVETWLMDND